MYIGGDFLPGLGFVAGMDVEKEFLKNYEIIAVLGKGGMGKVLLARDKALKRLVALKMIKKSGVIAESGSQSEHIFKRIHQEAIALASLRHSNIVSINTIWPRDMPDFSDTTSETEVPTICLDLEYVEGSDLEKICKQRPERHMEQEEALGYCIEVANALRYSHSRGIVHRDIKPANIIREHKTHRIVLLDFGLVSFSDLENKQALTQQAIGTPAFMSPEQILNNKDIDSRTDIYSLGLTFYYLLTGNFAFYDESFFVLCQQQVEDPPKPLREHDPRISELVERAVLLAIEKKPDDRIQSMAQFGELLHSILNILKNSKLTHERPTSEEIEAMFQKASEHVMSQEDNGETLVMDIKIHQAPSSFSGGIHAATQEESDQTRADMPSEAAVSSQPTKEDIENSMKETLGPSSSMVPTPTPSESVGITRQESVKIPTVKTDTSESGEFQAQQSRKLLWGSIVFLLVVTLGGGWFMWRMNQKLSNIQGSASPATQIASQPATQPATEPTAVPTEVVQTIPATIPTSVPTTRPQPTRVAVVAPTTRPTKKLVVPATALPTKSPTKKPTVKPKPRPTSKPKVVRSNKLPALSSIGLQSSKNFMLDANGVRVEMVWIPGGTFSMGSDNTTREERPSHSVTVGGYWIGRFEITQAQFKKIMGKNPSIQKGDSLPVHNVSWNDAMAFCQKLTTKAGRTVRLPSEQQWEFACRAGDRDDLAQVIQKDLSRYVVFRKRKPERVGYKSNQQLKANRYGLSNMLGNVREWCSSYYLKYPKHDESEITDPESAKRVIRGRSFSDRSKDKIRSTYREPQSPFHVDVDYGFRIVVTGS